MKRKFLIFGTAAASVILVAAAFFIYYRFDPEGSVFFPKCPFKLLTGLDCPGCGSQRAIHSLLHGDIIKALKTNALVVISIPYLLLFVILELVKSLSSRDSIRARAGRAVEVLYRGKAVFIVMILILIFWLSRNLNAGVL